MYRSEIKNLGLGVPAEEVLERFPKQEVEKNYKWIVNFCNDVKNPMEILASISADYNLLDVFKLYDALAEAHDIPTDDSVKQFWKSYTPTAELLDFDRSITNIQKIAKGTNVLTGLSMMYSSLPCDFSYGKDLGNYNKTFGNLLENLDVYVELYKAKELGLEKEMQECEDAIQTLALKNQNVKQAVDNSMKLVNDNKAVTKDSLEGEMAKLEILQGEQRGLVAIIIFIRSLYCIKEHYKYDPGCVREAYDMYKRIFPILIHGQKSTLDGNKFASALSSAVTISIEGLGEIKENWENGNKPTGGSQLDKMGEILVDKSNELPVTLRKDNSPIQNLSGNKEIEIEDEFLRELVSANPKIMKAVETTEKRFEGKIPNSTRNNLRDFMTEFEIIWTESPVQKYKSNDELKKEIKEKFDAEINKLQKYGFSLDIINNQPLEISIDEMYKAGSSTLFRLDKGFKVLALDKFCKVEKTRPATVEVECPYVDKTEEFTFEWVRRCKDCSPETMALTTDLYNEFGRQAQVGNMRMLRAFALSGFWNILEKNIANPIARDTFIKYHCLNEFFKGQELEITEGSVNKLTTLARKYFTEVIKND